MMRELLLVGLLGVSLAKTMAQETGESPPPIRAELKAIARAAVECAQSPEAGRQEKARVLLTDPGYLHQLNTDQEYQIFPTESLQLWFILKALCANPAAEAVATLNTLAGSPVYREDGLRRTVLLKATQHARNAPANLQRLWRDQIRPGAEELNLAVETLVANGSPEAIQILEQELLRNEHESDYVVAWLQDPILRHRQDPLLLEACERLLRARKWPEPLKRALVEALFEYRPGAWYLKEQEPPKPPDRGRLTESARRRLNSIADLALKSGWVSPERRARIRQELEGK